MKDTNLLTPELHDFSDLGIKLPKKVIACVALVCLGLLVRTVWSSDRVVDQAAAAKPLQAATVL